MRSLLTADIYQILSVAEWVRTLQTMSPCSASIEDLPLQIHNPMELEAKPAGAFNRDRSFLVQDWRVLHIEDDDGDAYLLMRALDQAAIPARVHRCLDSEEALLFLREMRLSDPLWPDVVLLDLNTPRMNGWEFLATVNADKALFGLHVIIVTSSRSPEDRERALGLGVKDFQTKPDDFDELVRMVEGIFVAPARGRSGTTCDTEFIVAR